jgi:transcription antitermination factor NusG
MVDLKEGLRGLESNFGGEMERGDKVRIRTGAWVDKTGAIVWVHHEAELVTVALDEGPTHMVKTSMNNIERIPCKLPNPVV